MSEECGEVIQAIGKILRHGYTSTHPSGGLTNRGTLMKEIGDIYIATGMMVVKKDIDEDFINRCMETKSDEVMKYLHPQGE